MAAIQILRVIADGGVHPRITRYIKRVGEDNAQASTAFAKDLRLAVFGLAVRAPHD